ncbi:MAG: efflux RND transporter periplasmic adaptor subunit [Elusimicrobiota bacterium]|nr:efflux RND transporter periplasmic adaptor subunit [Elusimicrobiota bacterium]
MKIKNIFMVRLLKNTYLYVVAHPWRALFLTEATQGVATTKPFFLNSFIVLFLIIPILSLGIQSCSKKETSHGSSKKISQKYHCPMHPTYISDKPGDCPICGMKLVPSDEKETTTQPAKKKTMYRSSMSPNEISDKPGKDSMGMEMVPYEIEENSPAGTSKVEGLSSVTISEEKQQSIGVKTAIVKTRKLIFDIRASGRVAHDPELYNAIIEYQQTLSRRNELVLKSAPKEQEQGFIQQADSLINSSTLRLKHLGLSDAQITELSKSSETFSNLILVGKPGGTVWVYAQIYISEFGVVKPGQIMEVTSISLPGKKFRGEIKAVDTYLDSESRTLRVRAEVSNPEGLLKPDMYVDAVIHVDFGEKIAVSEEAVIDSGTRQIVFVKKAAGVYEPREIQVGHTAEGYYEIISGLSVGEEVVTSANFLIDSESKLKSAIQGMGSGEHKHGK